jgi:hypothetical protein
MGAETPQFIVLRPRNGEAAAAGNGLTVGFAAPSRGAVKEFHRIALSLGAMDEGRQGHVLLRPMPTLPT